MKVEDVLAHIDHTYLKADATWEDIGRICREALEYNTASACIPPSFVARASEEFGDKLNICTVIGFPLGYSCLESKLSEAKKALKDGASEIDMVINIGDLKAAYYDRVRDEIRVLKELIGDKILKVIIETCYLTEAEKIKMCEIITEAGADYIKTSTGFGSAGAKLEDIILFKKHLGPDVKIKAAGGVRSLADMEKFIEEGCSRIGSSSTGAILKGEETKGY